MKISFKYNNGVIPRFFRQLHCGLWKGHEYKAVSPEYQGVRVCECQKCGKTSVF